MNVNHVDMRMRFLWIGLFMAKALQAQTAEEFFIAGTTAQLAGDADDALEQFQRALEAKPNHAPILFSMGEVHLQEKNYTTALYYATKAVEIAPTEWEYVRLKAEIERASANQNAAVRSIETYLTQVPNHRYATLMLVEIYFGQNQVDKGVQRLKDWFARFPQDWEIGERLAEQLGKQGDYLQQIEVQKRLIETRGVEVALLNQLENSFLQAQQKNAWKTYLENLVRKFPEDTFLKRRLANLQNDAVPSQGLANLTTDELLQQAQAAYAKINEPKAYQTLKNILALLNRQNGDWAEVQEMNAVVWEREGDYAKAAAAYATLAQQQAARLDIWCKAVALMTQSGNPQRALEIGEEASFLFAGNIGLGIEVAKAHLALNTPQSTSNAQRILTETLGVAESDRHAVKADWIALYTLLAETYTRQGNSSQAQQMRQKAASYQ